MEITQKIETGNIAQKQQAFLSYFGRSETKPAYSNVFYAH